MKRLLLALAILATQTVTAKNYYVSSSGNDANAGTSTAAAWKTISKVNSFFSSLAAGDSLLFKRGETFFGKLVVNKSGTAALPIIIGAYGSGARPIITAMTDVTGWTSLGGNLWKSAAIANVKNTLDIVMINSTSVAMGRYPNSNAASKGYLYFEAVSGKTGITDNELPSSPSWTGAEIVLKPNPWTINPYPVTAHSGTSLTFSGNTVSIRNNYGYFIQNHISTLDQQNEWFLDKTTKQLVMYSTTAPVNVKVSTVDTLCYVYNKSYITIKDLEFVGANQEGISLSVTSGVVVDGCFIHYSGTNAIRARASVAPLVQNCIMWDNFNCAVSFDDSGNSNAIIKNNKINRTGAVPGKGEEMVGIHVTGSGHLIEGNTVDSTGYSGIYFAYGNNITVKNNIVNYYCYVKSDGGGIYTWNNTATPTTYTNRKVIGNIVMNGVGATEGTPGTTPDVDGIYMDDNTSNVEILDNTVAYVAGSGMYIHNNFNMNIQRNTLFANGGTQLSFVHNPAYINGVLASYTTPLRNITVKKNVLFSKIVDHPVFQAYSIRNDLDSTGISDSNYYARPMDDDLTLDITRTISGTLVNTDYNLPSWRTQFKRDAASKKSPLAIPQYTVNSYTTANLFANGQYTSNISGTAIYSANGNHTLTWDNTGKITGGALKLSFPTVNTTDYTSLYAGVGAVSSAKTYILKLSTLGTTDTGSLRVYIRKTGSPYSPLTKLVYKPFGKTKTDHEFLFTAPTTMADASILIEFKQNSGTVYLDNVEFYEANTTPTNIDDNVKFVYNATATAVSLPLPFKYLSVDSVEYNGTITLQPYSSKVLLKKGPVTGVLPVKVSSFDAVNVKNKIQVQWKTATEINSSHYIIQRSSNGRDFENVGRVNSFNNSDRQSSYSFTDVLPLKGTSYYRLAMVDKDGAMDYSKTVAVNVRSANSIDVESMALSTGGSNIKLTLLSNKQQEVNLAVMDATGRILMSSKVLAQEGSTRVEKNIPAVGAGVYYVKVFTNDQVFTRTVMSDK